MTHYIRPNRVGYFITGIDDQPLFKEWSEAMKWAKDNGIEITLEK